MKKNLGDHKARSIELATKKIKLLTLLCFQRFYDESTDDNLSWDSFTLKGYKLYGKTAFLFKHGQHDDNLVWPFKKTIQFKLLNQERSCLVWKVVLF